MAWSSSEVKDLVVDILSCSTRAMSGEDLVDRCIDAGYKPEDQRAFGAVFAGLSRAGVIRCVGFAMRRKGNGTAGARLWEATG